MEESDMELVCPLCNAMVSYLLKCPKCNHSMENTGTIQDYLDDYSTYLPMDLTQRIDGVSKEYCMHLFYCKHCNSDKRIAIDRVSI